MRGPTEKRAGGGRRETVTPKSSQEATLVEGEVEKFVDAGGGAPPSPPFIGGSMDILVTTARVKKFIKDEGKMNTSSAAPEALSKVVERVLAQAIKNARLDGRKTVLDRDIESVKDLT